MRSAKSDITRRILSTVLTVLWMGFIFFMSSQNADRSSEESGRLVKLVIRIFFPDWKALPENEYLYSAAGLTFMIRKAAHFTEYAILGALLGSIFATFRVKWSLRILAGLLIGVEYAAGDEFHQSFTDGRYACLFDVLVDSAGAAVGLLILLGITAMVLNERIVKSS